VGTLAFLYFLTMRLTAGRAATDRDEV